MEYYCTILRYFIKTKFRPNRAYFHTDLDIKLVTTLSPSKFESHEILNEQKTQFNNLGNQTIDLSNLIVPNKRLVKYNRTLVMREIETPKSCMFSRTYLEV